MIRTLNVTVDESTWPSQPGVPVFPTTFQAGTKPLDLNIPRLLLLIGYLTTPSHSRGTSLSEFWAWVRYFNSVSETPDLQLTREFADLDAHQKTILSDDFGMGVPIYWLSEHFPLEPPVDGRYFMDRLAAASGVNVADPPKQGPRKAPDFVARDTSGVWHVIECKGTQSGNAYRKRQLGSPGPAPTGAVAQKRTLTFPAGYTGQRLACGLVLAVEDSFESSSLRVIDPPLDEGFGVEEKDLPVAIDTLKRATASSVLRLAGFGVVSSAASSLPSTALVTEVRDDDGTKGLEWDIETIAHRAREQLMDRHRYQSFETDHGKYLGREIRLDLADPIRVQGRGVRPVLLRYGVTGDLLDAMEQEIEVYGRQASTDLSHSGNFIPQWHEMLGHTRLESDDDQAIMRIGSSFFGEIRLLI